MLEAWLRAFLLTQIVEVPVYRFAGRVRLVHAFAPSAITHPFVWFAFPLLSDTFLVPWSVTIVLAETFAWLVEAAYLAKVARVPARRALALSFAANAASVVVGLALREAFGIV